MYAGIAIIALLVITTIIANKNSKQIERKFTQMDYLKSGIELILVAISIFVSIFCSIMFAMYLIYKYY